MSSLAEDLITSILIRLPVKSLLRFRCVSKSWCFQIDSPDFIKLHLTHSVATPSNYIAETSEQILSSLDTDSLKNLVIIEYPFINIYDLISLFNTCNGLILLEVNHNHNDLILFNPSTRKHIVLPTSPPANKYDYLVYLDCPRVLGYDAVNDDYKVFAIRQFKDRTDKFISCEAKIYSLKSNSWRIVKDFTKGISYTCLFATSVKGALFSFDYNDCSNFVALDVGKEEFYKIPMPNFEDNNVSHFIASAFYGCLAVSCLYLDDRVDIWVMKEFEVKSSWSMLLSVKPEIICDVVTPMVYSESRTEVLLCYDFEDVVWYDLRKKTIRALDDTDLPVGYCEVYVESLVPFGGTGRIDEKKQHEEEK